MLFCEISNHTLEQAMEYDVSTLFYFVSYEVQRRKKQADDMKRQNRR